MPQTRLHEKVQQYIGVQEGAQDGVIAFPGGDGDRFRLHPAGDDRPPGRFAGHLVAPVAEDVVPADRERSTILKAVR